MTAGTDQMLTIVIPTRNRSAHVERLLSYYGRLGSSVAILIGDSSDGEEAKRMAAQAA